MSKETVALILSILSFIVSIFAIIFSTRSSYRANKIASDNLSIQHGMIELEIRQSIESSKKSINDLAIVMAPLKAKEKKNNLTEEDEHTLSIYEKSFIAAIQTFLNNYDGACSKFIDGKIDKVRFKKNYQIEIRNLLENEDLKEYFDPHTSRYKPILKVYSEWEDPEK